LESLLSPTTTPLATKTAADLQQIFQGITDQTPSNIATLAQKLIVMHENVDKPELTKALLDQLEAQIPANMASAARLLGPLLLTTHESLVESLAAIISTHYATFTRAKMNWRGLALNPSLVDGVVSSLESTKALDATTDDGAAMLTTFLLGFKCGTTKLTQLESLIAASPVISQMSKTLNSLSDRKIEQTKLVTALSGALDELSAE